MAIIKCKECGTDVSSKAKTCPSCGISNPGIKTKDAILGGITLVVIISAAIWFFDDTPEKNNNAQKVAIGQSLDLTGNRGCETRIAAWGRYMLTASALIAKQNNDQEQLEKASSGVVSLTKESCYTELNGQYKILDISSSLESNDPSLGYDGSSVFYKVTQNNKELWVLE